MSISAPGSCATRRSTSLTGLANRTLILDRAEHLLRRARRTRAGAAALFIDLDGFKDINDTVGHEAGDHLLRATAERLRRVLRQADTVGRMGGDEFVVLLEGGPAGPDPEAVAARILEVLGEPFSVSGADFDFAVTASIGIAIVDEQTPTATATDLLRDADVALYRAKAAGRNRFVVFQPEMQAVLQVRLTLTAELREAIAAGQFFLEYQPFFDVETKTVRGVEALVRWAHPTRGVVPPLDFIPLAEEAGLIADIGAWVLDEACRQMAAWKEAGHDLRVNVNVSPRQLERPDFADRVAEAVRRWGLAPESLVLEITESALMVHAEQMAARLAALKALGVQIAIDDFGTGYSSLSYLRQFPVDSIKIDRSFLSDLGHSAEAHALVHSLIQLGKNLGLETVAEGIEDDAQMDLLEREQCDRGQGFVFSRPLGPEAVARLLAKQAPAAS